MDLINQFIASLAGLDNAEVIAQLEEVRELLHKAHPLHEQPIDRVKWVPIEQVTPASRGRSSQPLIVYPVTVSASSHSRVPLRMRGSIS